MRSIVLHAGSRSHWGRLLSALLLLEFNCTAEKQQQPKTNTEVSGAGLVSSFRKLTVLIIFK